MSLAMILNLFIVSQSAACHILSKGFLNNYYLIIEKFKSIFSRHGIPDQVISDNGPQYASLEFKEFIKVYKCKHITSYPR